MIKFPKSNTDNNGLIRSNKRLVSSMKSSSLESGTTKYIGNLVNYSTSYWWCSRNTANSYFYIEFIKPICITNYSLEVYDWGNIQAYPVSWKGIGRSSNKQETFTVISSSGINRNNRIKTYKTLTSGPFKSIQFIQTGPNLRGDYYFCLGKLDIFGSYDPDKSSRSKQNHETSLHKAVML